MDGYGARRKQCVRRASEVGEVRAGVFACIDSVAEARASIIQYLVGTTDLGPHLGSGRETPDETYAVMLCRGLNWQREN